VDENVVLDSAHTTKGVKMTLMAAREQRCIFSFAPQGFTCRPESSNHRRSFRPPLRQRSDGTYPILLLLDAFPDLRPCTVPYLCFGLCPFLFNRERRGGGAVWWRSSWI